MWADDHGADSGQASHGLLSIAQRPAPTRLMGGPKNRVCGRLGVSSRQPDEA
jgi:hypothetical protein